MIISPLNIEYDVAIITDSDIGRYGRCKSESFDCHSV